MKIVFVSDGIYPYMHGGKEKRLYELSTRLAQRGHEVHIFTMHWWQSPQKVITEDGVTLHALCKKYEMYKGDRRTIKEAIFFSLACFKLFSVKFDVLDVDHMPFFPIFSAWLVCVTTGRRKKLYGTWHEALTREEWTSYMGVGGNLAAVIERLCIQLPHTITASSAHTKELIPQRLGRNSNLHTVTPGIDTRLMNAISPAPIRCDVLAVCRLVKDKNMNILIDSIKLLSQTNPKIKCIVIGCGPEKRRLLKQVERLSLKNNVMFIDRLPKAEDIYGYMKAAKVFCLPTAREGFGIVTLEALGCGTPVVTLNSPTNASRDFIASKKNGSIVSLSPEAISKAINYWIKTPKPKDIVNKVSRFDWNILTKQQEKVYVP